MKPWTALATLSLMGVLAGCSKPGVVGRYVMEGSINQTSDKVMYLEVRPDKTWTWSNKLIGFEGTYRVEGDSVYLRATGGASRPKPSKDEMHLKLNGTALEMAGGKPGQPTLKFLRE